MSAQKRIWLTGASSGIGQSIAEQLAMEGHLIAVSARREDPLQKLADRFPGQILVLPVDMTDADAVRQVGMRIGHAWGALDWAILNAGTCEYVDIAEFESAMFQRVMQANVQGTVQCIEAALPLLRKGTQPRLIGVGSSVTFCPLPRAAAYGASKAAIRYLFQSLELDLAQWNIGVTLVSPGFVETPLTAANDFPMPMQVDSDDAAAIIIRGIEKGKREISFPTPFIAVLKLIGGLPDRLRVALTKRMARPASNKEAS
ncbi:MAG: SDR family NAD(P)-dependent oxidoreductase [Pseudomonas sp.]|jgi:short-subunit dehydrogenase|uniref:SDR family NAD(P)-dependent oxidoreductase n=1 Tax=Halopseudomonas TaxID=2901189 RepID=UPI001B5845DB|nr:SDR family NAD(P)-dependent oxidoreductase [Pseudomonas sp.]MBQ0778969.1 SDR family NAD(P)-dependent oxidoreductase [Pseudomonas sp.]WOD10766.1 SDR family NAD(P)-dependent oxidoreductase [Pseudomonas sp. NyZ704]|tara:strand:- start:23 stop:796 length:774 start_codon:yes stop_codon:yes gene_type:complete